MAGTCACSIDGQHRATQACSSPCHALRRGRRVEHRQRARSGAYQPPSPLRIVARAQTPRPDAAVRTATSRRSLASLCREALPSESGPSVSQHSDVFTLLAYMRSRQLLQLRHSPPITIVCFITSLPVSGLSPVLAPECFGWWVVGGTVGVLRGRGCPVSPSASIELVGRQAAEAISWSLDQRISMSS